MLIAGQRTTAAAEVKQTAAFVAKHNPVTVAQAVFKPVYTAAKTVVSVAASVPAAVVAVSKDVVKDVSKSVQVIYEPGVCQTRTV